MIASIQIGDDGVGVRPDAKTLINKYQLVSINYRSWYKSDAVGFEAERLIQNVFHFSFTGELGFVLIAKDSLG